MWSIFVISILQKMFFFIFSKYPNSLTLVILALEPLTFFWYNFKRFCSMAPFLTLLNNTNPSLQAKFDYLCRLLKIFIKFYGCFYTFYMKSFALFLRILNEKSGRLKALSKTELLLINGSVCEILKWV